MFKLFDSHTHVQFADFAGDYKEVIQRALENGIGMVNVGTDKNTSQRAVEIANEFETGVWAAVGLHPTEIGENFDYEFYKKLAGDKKVVAIGECGLDYYRLEVGSGRLEAEKTKSLQKDIFLKQVELAREVGKPLMIHCRPSSVKTSAGKAISTDDAYEDLLEILKEIKFSQNIILHFYAGSLEMARKFLDAGFCPHTKRASVLEGANGANARYGVGVYFTFGGVITFTHDYDEVIKYLPLDRILLETDAPYVAPAPYRGKRNEPAYVLETAKKMAEIKKLTLEQVSEQTLKNSLTIFKLSDIL